MSSDEEYDVYLVADGYSGVHFSAMFQQVFVARFPHKAHLLDWKYIHKMETRRDPDIVALVRELGLEASAAEGTRMKLYKLLRALEPHAFLTDVNDLEMMTIDYFHVFHRKLLEEILALTQVSDVELSTFRERYERWHMLLKNQRQLNRY